MTQLTISVILSCAVELFRLVTSDNIGLMTSLLKKVINIDQNSRSQTAIFIVSKLSTESVGSRRELVANCANTADATQLVASASAACIGLN